jgi:hypothetical protein
MIGDRQSVDEHHSCGVAEAEKTTAIEPSETIAVRLASVDILRGLIMVLMVLDHTRDFISNVNIDPTNVATTTVPLFFTRWVPLPWGWRLCWHSSCSAPADTKATRRPGRFSRHPSRPRSRSSTARSIRRRSCMC